ncbi:MAG: hypothetical protein F2704_04870 [Actinobacteria bacterium]|nr:hypothetical protein [Actinomycetota bacterium]MSX25204.1 hypothetical protein [Actinomycetota bacterium]MSY57580.1 hypothetical protein [Actinomycetota bacterium]MTB00880.1 hypothetical protein [Actinomycetota bacterium]
MGSTWFPTGLFRKMVILWRVATHLLTNQNEDKQVPLIRRLLYYRPMPTLSHMLWFNDQAEVDKYWDALTADGGTPGRCGWLKDKFGLSWQIIPKQLGECLGNPDPTRSAAAMNAMMGMSKLIVSELEAAVK